MKIKKMYATFGKLDKSELSFKDGLNIIYGGNESGKSTWSAFIRAMLYGISTREKARAGHMPDKEKYMPWSRAPMYGRMELDTVRGAVTIERTAGKSGVLSSAVSTYDANGAPAPTGEELLGAAREVYERTAFIAQTQLKVDHNGEIERRILSIAGSGDEEVSFAEIKARLTAKKRTIRTVRDGGELSQTEAEISDTVRRISEGEELLKSIEVHRARLNSLSCSLQAAERAVSIKCAVQSRERRLFKERTLSELEAARETADKLRNGPHREELEKLSALISEKVNAESEIARLSASLSAHESEAMRIREKADDDSSFAGLTRKEAELRAESDIRLLHAKSKNKRTTPIFLICGVLSLIGILLCIFSDKLLIKLTSALPSAALIAAAILIFIRGDGKIRSASAKRLTELYGDASEEKILSRLGNYIDLLDALEKTHDGTKIDSAMLDAAKEREIKLREDIAEALSAAGLAELSAEDGERKLRELVLAREAALRAENEAEIRARAISDSSPDINEAEPEFADDEIPQEPLEALRERYSELSRLHREAELALAALEARAAGFDMHGYERALSSLRAKEKELSLQYEALDMAIDELALADGELRSRFAPELSRRASEIFSDLTGGEFEIVHILSSDFDMDVAESAASNPRDVLQLSRGTLDELYLSLRLALCELMLGGDEMPPMILDDVFVNFDKTRLGRALDILKKLSKNRQIILFSCHEREADYLRNDPDVGIIKLM